MDEEARRQEVQMYIVADGRMKCRPNARTSLMVVVVWQTKAAVAGFSTGTDGGGSDSSNG